MIVKCKDCEHSEKRQKNDGTLLPLQRCAHDPPSANGEDNSGIWPMVNLERDGCSKGATPKKTAKPADKAKP